MPSDKNKVDLPTLSDFSRFGSYSIFILIVGELTLLPEVLNVTFMVFGGIIPTINSCGKYNFSGLSNVETCDLLEDAKNETRCQPILKADFESLAYEFELYCENTFDIKGSISLFMFGCLIGSALFGKLSDGFGRKRMILISHIGMFIFDFFASRSRSFSEFVTIQFITTFFAGGHSAVMYVFLLESMPKRHRLWVTFILTYSPNCVISAIIAYYAGNWRTLLQIISTINILAFCMIIIAFESPRWLIQKGKIEAARIALRKIERINGSDTKERLELLDNLIEKEKESIENQRRKKRYYFYHLFYSLKTSIYTIIISYSLVFTSLITFATVFNLEYLTGSVYLNIIIYGLFRYFINITAGLCDFKIKSLGRKTINSAFLTLIFLLLGCVTITKLLGIDCSTLVRFCTLISAALGSQFFAINAIVTSELFPTAVRNIAASFVQVFAQFGGILAPYLFYLSTFWDPFPYLVLLIFTVTNMFLFIVFIPETKNTSLADHLPHRFRKFLPEKTPLTVSN